MTPRPKEPSAEMALRRFLVHVGSDKSSRECKTCRWHLDIIRRALRKRRGR